MAQGEKVQADKSEFDDLKAQIAALKASQPAEIVKAVLDAVQQGAKIDRDKDAAEKLRDEIRNRPAPGAVTYVFQRSEQTGATFWAKVAASNTFPQGRVIDLMQYTHPEGTEVSQDNGGLYPSGSPEIKEPSGAYSAYFKSWRWNEFFKRDLQSLVGRALISRLTVTPQPERPVDLDPSAAA